MEHDDETLMIAHRNGDADAFGVLVNRHAGLLLGYLTRMVGDRQQAEDVFQEAFAKVHAGRGSYREGAPFKPWLFTIATRCALDLIRKRQRRPAPVSYDDEAIAEGLQGELVDAAPDPSANCERNEVKEQVEKAVKMLPERQRAALLLSYFHGMSYPEVAEAMKCSLGSVKTHMSRALQTLAKRLPDARSELS
jgi:RNA polymerase sigma-70 factor (ECF subfamily)